MSFIRIKVRLKMKSESIVKNTIFGKQRLEIQYFGKGQNWSKSRIYVNQRRYVGSAVKKLTLNVCFFLKLKKKAFYDLLKFVRSAIVRFYFYLFFVYFTHWKCIFVLHSSV